MLQGNSYSILKVDGNGRMAKVLPEIRKGSTVAKKVYHLSIGITRGQLLIRILEVFSKHTQNYDFFNGGS
jgi:hypothetical protein